MARLFETRQVLSCDACIPLMSPARADVQIRSVAGDAGRGIEVVGNIKILVATHRIDVRLRGRECFALRHSSSIEEIVCRTAARCTIPLASQ